MKMLLWKAVTILKNSLWLRSLAILSALCFVTALFTKLWSMVLTSTFYFAGLHLDVNARGVTGDLHELNILNHYIGMQTIGNNMPEFHYIGWVIGILLLASLGVASFPSRRVTLSAVIVQTVLLIGLAVDFLYRLYEYGHDFDPNAPIKVSPFMPQIWGNYQLANFHVVTTPGTGSLLIILGYLLIIAVFSLQKQERAAVKPVRKM